MSIYLRKCIDIAPTAIISPEQDPPNDYRKLVSTPWWPALRATTSHLRLWADWPSLQPIADELPGTGAKAQASLANLDGQVKSAAADGMQVILIPYRYPTWSNGTAGIVPGSQPDSDLEPWNRVARATAYANWIAGAAARPSYKDIKYRMTTDGYGVDSAWGKFVGWLWDRYVTHADVNGRVAAFEVVNEPNGQLWPQRTTIDTNEILARWGTADTHLSVPAATADMMVTMDTIARRHDRAALCLGPSTSDTLMDDIPRTTTISHRTEYTTATETFVEALLEELDHRGFTAGDHWIWSFHNYSDVERNYKHVVYLRQLLRTRGWDGRELDGGPELWCTEGGCRLIALNSMTGRFRLALGRQLTADEQLQFQALVLTEALSRHHSSKGAGAGVGMLTQYTTYADSFTSGVLDGNGIPRPSLAAWSRVPEYVGAPTQRAAWRPQP